VFVAESGLTIPGTVFQITPAGALTTLYQFSPHGSGPTSIMQGNDGNLYGTVDSDEAPSDGGQVFRLNVSYIPLGCHP
jgi:hypothetical protein